MKGMILEGFILTEDIDYSRLELAIQLAFIEAEKVCSDLSKFSQVLMTFTRDPLAE